MRVVVRSGVHGSFARPGRQTHVVLACAPAGNAANAQTAATAATPLRCIASRPPRAIESGLYWRVKLLSRLGCARGHASAPSRRPDPARGRRADVARSVRRGDHSRAAALPRGAGGEGEGAARRARRLERELDLSRWRRGGDAVVADRVRARARGGRGLGGGGAEMLWSLIAYARATGVDARWVVIGGEDDFFRVTKRIHNNLHGHVGD